MGKLSERRSNLCLSGFTEGTGVMLGIIADSNTPINPPVVPAQQLEARWLRFQKIDCYVPNWMATDHAVLYRFFAVRW